MSLGWDIASIYRPFPRRLFSGARVRLLQMAMAGRLRADTTWLRSLVQAGARSSLSHRRLGIRRCRWWGTA